MRKSLRIPILVILFSGVGLSQNSWEFTGGPYCGAAHVIVTNTFGHIFAGTSSSVYRSTDDGSHWVCVKGGPGNHILFSMAINPIGTIYIGLDTGNAYRSSNNGDSWELVNNGLPPRPITVLTCQGNDTVYAGTDNAGVYRSDNDGDLWSAKSQGLTNLGIHALTIKSNGNVYAGTEKGIFESTNGGDQWSPFSDLNKIITNIKFNPAGEIFVVGDYLYRSTDNGYTWKNLSVDSTQVTVPYPHWVVTYKQHPSMIAMDTEGNIVADDIRYSSSEHKDKLFQSSDNGDSWIPLLMNYPPSRIGYISNFSTSWGDSLYIGSITSITLHSDGHIIAGSSMSGILRLHKNDTNWDFLNKNLESKPIYSMVVQPDSGAYVLSEGGLLHLSKSGKKWVIDGLIINSNHSGITVCSSGNIVVGSQSMARASWGPIAAFSVASEHEYLYAGSYLSVAGRSTDCGISWDTITQYAICSTFVAGISGNVYGLSANVPGYNGGVMRSTDHGNTWIPIGYGIPVGDDIITYNPINMLAENSLGDAFVGTDMGAYRLSFGDTDMGTG